MTNLSLQGWLATKSGTARVSGALGKLVGEAPIRRVANGLNFCFLHPLTELNVDCSGQKITGAQGRTKAVDRMD